MELCIFYNCPSFDRRFDCALQQKIPSVEKLNRYVVYEANIIIYIF
jgi:hypothetical protein